MPRLVLVNGVPGVGKSTVARLLAEGSPLALALDVDDVLHALGRWEADPSAAGLQARRLALAMAATHLGDGHDVFIGQFLARAEFIEQLAALDAPFREFILEAGESVIAARLAHRAGGLPPVPDRRLVDTASVAGFVEAMSRLRLERPAATVVDATGTPEQTAARIRAHLDSASVPGA